jgi:hypothetical protein
MLLVLYNAAITARDNKTRDSATVTLRIRKETFGAGVGIKKPPKRPARGIAAEVAKESMTTKNRVRKSDGLLKEGPARERDCSKPRNAR